MINSKNIFGANISKRRVKNISFDEFNDGYFYYDTDKGYIISFWLWKRLDTKLHILLPRKINYTIMNDIEKYCYENKLNTVTLKYTDKETIEYYKKYGFNIDTNDDTILIKEIKYKRVIKSKSIQMIKESYPLIASMMPIDLNVTKNQLF